MAFDFSLTGEAGLMEQLAKTTGSAIEKGTLTLPQNFGEGYIKGLDLGPFLKMMIVQCTLQEDVIINRKAAQAGSGAITFSFRNVFNQIGEQKHGSYSPLQSGRLFPSVQVSSGDINLALFFPAKAQIHTIIITTQVELLKGLLNQQESHSLLQSIVSGTQPYLYEELISPDIQQVAIDIVSGRIPELLYDFYIKIKAQELICLFFVELLKRQDIATYPVNAADITLMYQLRDSVIADLSIPPTLTELAHRIGMSESKMKRLFKQIFGDSIYRYYQTFRMNEAAYLIKDQHLSVTETGLRLGFSNLSHFTRLFEKHIGQKPKKYSSAR